MKYIESLSQISMHILSAAVIRELNLSAVLHLLPILSEQDLHSNDKWFCAKHGVGELEFLCNRVLGQRHELGATRGFELQFDVLWHRNHKRKIVDIIGIAVMEHRQYSAHSVALIRLKVECCSDSMIFVRLKRLCFP